MAELDVQRKKSSPLPWILLIIAILAIAAYFLTRDNEVVEEGAAPVTYDSTQRTGSDTLPR